MRGVLQRPDHGHQRPCCSSIPSRSPRPKATGASCATTTWTSRRSGRTTRAFSMGETRSIAGLEILAHSAGHIPGAQMYEIKGDIDHPVHRGPAHREHPPDLRSQAGQVRQSDHRGHLRRYGTTLRGRRARRCCSRRCARSWSAAARPSSPASPSGECRR